MSRRMWAVLVGGALAMVLGACSGTDEALPTPQPTIATILDHPDPVPPLKPDQSSLYVISPDGSDLKALFEGGGGLSFAVSPGGGQVAVMTQGRSESVLYLVDVATSASQEIARMPGMSLGGWSPDGDWLTLSIEVEGERLAVGVFSTSTGSIQPYTLPESEYSKSYFTRFIAWASDSNSVVLLHPGEDTTSVLQLDLTDGELVELLTRREFYPSVALSPDGGTLAVGVLENDGSSQATYTISITDMRSMSSSKLLSFTDEVPLSGGHSLAWSPDGSQLAYGRLTDTGISISQVFILGQDGESVQITNGEDGISGALLWSPKQDAVLIIRDICTSCDGSGKKVVLAPVDGSGEVRLPGAESYGHADAAWAPDGERFAYSGDALYIADSDASESNAIVAIEGASYGPIVWPTQDQIFFVRASTRAPITYLVEADGSSVEQFSVGANVSITGEAHGDWPWPTEGRFHQLVWSDDGSRAVISMVVDREWRLFLQEDGPSQLLTTHVYIQSLTWSPDGTRVAYEAERSVWVLDLHSMERKRLIDDVQNVGIAWTPDSKEIVAMIGERVVSLPLNEDALSAELFAIKDIEYGTSQLSVSADGSMIGIGSEHGLFIATRSTGQVVQVSEHSIRGLAWSPDGMTLAFGLRDTRGKTPSGVYLVSRDGQELRQLTEPSGRLHDVLYWLSDGKIMFMSHTNYI